MPEGIAKVEKALLCYDITAFLKCALAVCLTVKLTFSDGHSVAFIQCALLVETLIFDHFHLNSSIRPDISYNNINIITYFSLIAID